jgi:hypothetical protein
MKVKCPICDRLISLTNVVTDMSGARIMVWHVYAPDAYGVGRHECAGSHRTLEDATAYYEKLTRLENAPDPEPED